MTRHANKGLRKLCEHARRQWAKCDHPWHFSFKWKDTHYRFSLDKHLDKHIDSKSDAEDEAAKIRIAIKAGTFGTAAPVLDQLTVGQLLDVYNKRHVEIERKDSVTSVRYQIALIKRIEIERPDGRRQPLGDWRMADVTTVAIDCFKEARLARGVAAANRDLAFLRAAFNWAIRTKHVKETPFKLGTETVVKLSEEHARSRRLDGDEERALLTVCGSHLRAIVEAAIETGCRKGELLSMQWKQIEGMKLDGSTVTWAPKAELFLPFGKTKTKKDRRIPISSRLKAILEMRRLDAAGQPQALSAYVFGTEIGTRITGFQRAWHTAILRSHGYTPAYTKTANLTPESRAALATIDLHFHDLRREAGSRWMDGGVPIATIQRWLGHSNVSQTSTYLAGTSTSEHDHMRRYEAQQAGLQRIATTVGTGGKKRPRSAAGRKEKPSKTAVGLDTPIM